MSYITLQENVLHVRPRHKKKNIPTFNCAVIVIKRFPFCLAFHKLNHFNNFPFSMKWIVRVFQEFLIIIKCNFCNNKRYIFLCLCMMRLAKPHTSKENSILQRKVQPNLTILFLPLPDVVLYVKNKRKN